VFADLTPLRRYRDFRNIWIGQVISALGSQLTVVGVAYQAFVLTHSTLVVGLVSLVQLGPLLVGSLGGGSVADAMDRRRLLLITQVVLASTSAGLAVNALLPHPHLWPLFAFTAASAAFQGVDNPTRKAALPMIVPLQDLPAALVLQQVVFQLSLVAGPALAGLLIGIAGLSVVFWLDVASFGAAFISVILLPRLVPSGGGRRAGLASVVEGLRYLRGQRTLAATYWIDLDAMVFGMPRAVFPALALGLYRGGAGTLGILYAAPGAGALAGAVLTGWVARVRRQGRAVVVCVLCWGAAIAVFGVVRILWLGVAFLALAGAADVVSAVFRNAILQMTVPEEFQGRLAGTWIAVVTGGPRLGDAEAGVAAAIGGPQFAVWSGGLACIAGLGVLLWRVPELWRQDATALLEGGSSDPDPPSNDPGPAGPAGTAGA
jgi:predicted MFS family arabinose efflux permease